MISKKYLAISLYAVGFSSAAALTTGCEGTGTYVPPTPPSEKILVTGSISDIDGFGLETGFDYYLDVETNDGYGMGYLMPAMQSDINGNFALTDYSMIYNDASDSSCVYACVLADASGCLAYTADCWNPSYDVTTSIWNIYSTTNATIGILTADGFYDAYGAYSHDAIRDRVSNTLTFESHFATDLINLKAKHRAKAKFMTVAEIEQEGGLKLTNLKKLRGKLGLKDSDITIAKFDGKAGELKRRTPKAESTVSE